MEMLQLNCSFKRRGLGPLICIKIQYVYNNILFKKRLLGNLASYENYVLLVFLFVFLLLFLLYPLMF